MAIIDLEGYFYHGSKVSNLTRLSRSYATCDMVHGPVVYLTRDYNVADCYGDVFRVSLHGNANKIIDYDRSHTDQTSEAQHALLSLFKHHRELYHPLKNVGESLKLLGRRSGMKILYDGLQVLGIWMIYGKAGVFEQSGRQDRGVQYGVIDGQKVLVDRIVPASEYYASEDYILENRKYRPWLHSDTNGVPTF